MMIQKSFYKEILTVFLECSFLCNTMCGMIKKVIDMPKNEVVTLEVNNEVMEEIRNDFSSFLCAPSDLEYVIFQAKKDDLFITCYHSKHSLLYKIVFQGPSAIQTCALYQEKGNLVIPKEKTPIHYIDENAQIGSDEVGVGDFFGPIVVCAAYIKKEDLILLKEQGITDSKKLTDEKILTIVPPLLHRFIYSLLILEPYKYNELTKKGFNLNKIKAWLHNRALENVSKKTGHLHPIYVDQFCEERLYYRYLEDAPSVLKNITFQTKGESYYPSIALASCFARYYFLIKMQEMEKELGEAIPLGASKKVSDFAYSLYLEKGESYLLKYVKANFKNLQEIKERQ